MAINLISPDQISFGDVAAIAGLTDITIAFTILTGASVGNERLMTQWGSLNYRRAFIIQVTDGDDIGFAVNGNNGIYGRRTAGLGLTTTTLYRIVVHGMPGVGRM